MALHKGKGLNFTDRPAVIDEHGQLIAPVVVEFTPPPPAVELPPEEDWQRGDGDIEGIELEAVVPQAEEGPDWTQPIREYEEVREHLIYSANEAADHDM